MKQRRPGACLGAAVRGGSALCAALTVCLAAGPAGGAEPAAPVSTSAPAKVDFEDVDIMALLDTEIESASRKRERIFDSPVSASVVTGEQLRASGATSLPEALQLVPGVIVRETAAGSFHVHLRGLENVQHTGLSSLVNANTLVMVDERVVFDYVTGGSLFNEVPVHVEDVERIEVVRSPATALFGPNAVAGVINIVTRRAEEEGFHGRATVEAGVSPGYRTTLDGERLEEQPFEHRATASGSYRRGDWLLGLRAGHARRERTGGGYFGLSDGEVVDDPRTLASSTQPGVTMTDAWAHFPRRTLGVDRTSGAIFGRYGGADDDVSVGLEVGGQRAITQAPDGAGEVSGFTSMVTREASGVWADVRATLWGLYLHTSVDHLDTAIPGAGDDLAFARTVSATEASYRVGLGDFELRPGLAFRWIGVDDGPYPGGDQAITLLSGSLRAEYKPIPAVRLVAAVHLDKYGFQDRVYVDGQGAAVWQVTDDHLVRLAYGRATRSVFIADAFQYFDRATFVVRGNRDIEPLFADSVELGYRARLAGMLSLDLEAFYTHARRFKDLVIRDDPATAPIDIVFDQTETEYHQAGATLGLDLSATPTLTVRLFATAQESWIRNRQKREVIFVRIEDKGRHLGTPMLFGGFAVDYEPLPKLALHLDGLFTTGHTQVLPIAEETYGANLVLNLRVGYTIRDHLTVYATFRDLSLRGPVSVSPGADPVGMRFLAGLTMDW